MLITAVLHEAAADNVPSIVALLAQAGLPTADLGPAALDDFIVALDGGEVIGAVGLERHGDHGLLRSLVVAPEWRDQGLGCALVEAIEARATAAGLRSLTLLTQTAAPFFVARRYTAIDRAQAPTPVQASSEFTTLCPASSNCLTKTLARSDD
ncbi:MAG: arsenic resistance N-acetyltransferase ArsN2 [Burkholderiaceae bacterium]|nr:arsenic resistance N-acetyltransferase ArsN2 [Burkholderiaceae bacterium]